MQKGEDLVPPLLDCSVQLMPCCEACAVHDLQELRQTRLEVIALELNIEPAIAFGALLREDAQAAAYYDSCTREQREAILLQLDSVQDMKAFVQQLPNNAL